MSPSSRHLDTPFHFVYMCERRAECPSRNRTSGFPAYGSSSSHLGLLPYFLDLRYYATMTSCVVHISVLEATACCSLRSACFHKFHHYYETVRLLINHRVISIYKTSIPFTFRSLSDLPGMQILLCALATLLAPDET